MTFQKLTIRLNYNGPSGAEKCIKVGIQIEEGTLLWCLQSVALHSEGHSQSQSGGRGQFRVLCTDTDNLDARKGIDEAISL